MTRLDKIVAPLAKIRKQLATYVDDNDKACAEFEVRAKEARDNALAARKVLDNVNTLLGG